MEITVAEQLLDASVDGMLCYDRRLAVTYWNRRMEELTGLDRNAVLGRSLFEAFPDLVTSGESHHALDALSGRASDAGMRQLTSKLSDRTVYCLTRYRPLYDANETVTGGLATLRDVTPDIDSQAQARESEARFRIMADNAPVLLWMAGTDALCNFFNAKWLDFTGRTMEQEAGYGWAEGIHPEDFQVCVDTYMRAFAKRREFSIEYRLRRRDGIYRWVLDNGLPRFHTDGRFAGFIGSCVDITERKVAEEQREKLLRSEKDAHAKAQQLYEEAQAASRVKDEFLATVSHELRTPLNAIAGWADLLRRRMVEDEDLDTALESIDRNARVQTQLISDLLDVSRIVTGKIKLEVETVDLRAVARAAIESVRLSAQARKIDLRIAMSEAPVTVRGDSTRLQQVIWNLLTNAIKFTPERGQVDISVQIRDAAAVLVVEDNGAGISSDFLPFVFDRFRQQDGRMSRRHGGLGLGLSIVKNLVELHGGTVQVKSEERCGTRFEIGMPLGRVVRAVETHGPLRLVAGASRKTILSLLRILVVDDQQDVLKLVSRILEIHGATVLTASGAAEALIVLREGKVDFLLSDIGMPEIDGFSLISTVRSLTDLVNVDVPAAALSAHTRDEDRKQALRSGFQEHLAKPVQPDLLINTIAKLVGRSTEPSVV